MTDYTVNKLQSMILVFPFTKQKISGGNKCTTHVFRINISIRSISIGSAYSCLSEFTIPYQPQSMFKFKKFSNYFFQKNLSGLKFQNKKRK